MNEEARDILDVEKMAGYQLIRRRIQDEIDQAVKELRLIEREGRTLQDIGAEYVVLIERINGLQKALDIPEEIKERAWPSAEDQH